MDTEIVLNWFVFAAICLLSYSKDSRGLPHGLDSSQIPSSTKMLMEPAVLSEILESTDGKDEQVRSSREVHNNYNTASSNDIPRGRYKTSEIEHGTTVTEEDLEKMLETSSDLSSSHGTVRDPAGYPDGAFETNLHNTGQYNFAELPSEHINPPKYDENWNFEDDDDSFKVIPLNKQSVATDTNPEKS